MSLHEMMKSGLPMNRKERYFTGTVLPMIVCADGFRHLDVLAGLIPGCKLPRIESDPARANIQFFSEYSLVESIYGKKAKERFPDPPATKDTPDTVMLIRGEKTVLIALEAKVYHKPSLPTLVKQLLAQRAQLAYLRTALDVDEVWHAALLPQGYLPEVGCKVPSPDGFPFHVIRWEDLLESFRPHRPADDYFVGMLAYALDQWQHLCSKPASGGANAEGTRKGAEIVKRYLTDDGLRVMGRSGGLSGALLTADLVTGTWRAQDYEVSSAEKPANRNWFYVVDFVRAVESGALAGTPATSGTAGKRAPRPSSRSTGYETLTGAEIVATQGDPAVRTVGRQGGLHGSPFAADVATGGWGTWSYAVSPEAKTRNKNWFTVEEFLGRVLRR